MCLILFALHHHPDYPLIVAANRDEYYARPSRHAHFWHDAQHVFAGRDLQAGGTWMGITTTGRFAAVTNFRDTQPPPLNPTSDRPPTRGELVSSYLINEINDRDYLATVQKHAHCYNGFSLLVGNHQRLAYYNNRGHNTHQLCPGVYGLSNATLDAPWPKVKQGKQALIQTLERTTDPMQLMAVLTDTTQANNDQLPETGISRQAERSLSSRFIQLEHYGTRTSTLLMINHQHEVNVWEKTYQPGGKESPINTIQFELDN